MNSCGDAKTPGVEPGRYSPKQGRDGKGGGSTAALRRDNPGAYILLVYLVMADKEIEREDTLGDFEAMASNKE